MASSDSCTPVSSNIQHISKANNIMAVQLYHILSGANENIFFSPFSISTALAMLYNGTESETADEMHAVLGYKSGNLENQDVKHAFKELLDGIESSSGAYTMACANSVLSHNEFDVKQDYKSLLIQYFKALMEVVDFAKDSAKVVNKINQWVNEKTSGMITKFVDSLDESTVMILLNAVYFKGLWMNQFDKKSTYQQKFFNDGIESNAKLVDMMHLKKSFPYAEKDSFKALQLPYKGDEISMLILLPNAMNGIKDLESSLTTDLIIDLMQNMSERKVDVALPNFKMECSLQLKEHFQKLGMKKIFLPGANFGGISDSDKLCVSEIIHKAVVEVNEEGTKAAAVTGVVMLMCALTYDPEFIIDHPFLFVIYNTKSNLILFWGKVLEL